MMIPFACATPGTATADRRRASPTACAFMAPRVRRCVGGAARKNARGRDFDAGRRARLPGSGASCEARAAMLRRLVRAAILGTLAGNLAAWLVPRAGDADTARPALGA